MYAFYERICQHNYIITDYSGGCDVCENCGLVVNSQIFSSYNSTSYNQQKNTDDTDDIFTFNNLLQEGLNMLEEVGQKYNISNSITQSSKRILCDNEKWLKFSKLNELCAFSFFKSSQANKSIRTKQEICQMFNVSPKHLNDSFNKYETTTNQIDQTRPSDIFPRVEFPFKISYRHTVELTQSADLLFQKVNASPSAVLAFSIYQYCKDNYKELGHKKLSMNVVAKMCNVSSTSIKRLCNKIK